MLRVSEGCLCMQVLTNILHADGVKGTSSCMLRLVPRLQIEAVFHVHHIHVSGYLPDCKPLWQDYSAMSAQPIASEHPCPALGAHAISLSQVPTLLMTAAHPASSMYYSPTWSGKLLVAQTILHEGTIWTLRSSPVLQAKPTPMEEDESSEEESSDDEAAAPAPAKAAAARAAATAATADSSSEEEESDSDEAPAEVS